jgi:hypothetical protein
MRTINGRWAQYCDGEGIGEAQSFFFRQELALSVPGDRVWLIVFHEPLIQPAGAGRGQTANVNEAIQVCACLLHCLQEISGANLIDAQIIVASGRFDCPGEVVDGSNSADSLAHGLAIVEVSKNQSSVLPFKGMGSP